MVDDVQKFDALTVCSSKDFGCSSREVWAFLKLIQVLSSKLAKNGIDIETFQFFPMESKYGSVQFVNEQPLNKELYAQLFTESQEEIVKEYPYIVRSSYQIVSGMRDVMAWFEAIGRFFFVNVQSLDIDQYDDLVCKCAAKYYPQEPCLKSTLKARRKENKYDPSNIHNFVDTAALFNRNYVKALARSDIKAAAECKVVPSRLFTYHLTEEGKKAIETFETKLRNKKQTFITCSLLQVGGPSQIIETPIAPIETELCLEGGRNVRITDIFTMMAPVIESFRTNTKRLFDKMIIEHTTIKCGDYEIKGEDLHSVLDKVNFVFSYEVGNLAVVLNDLTKRQSEAKVCEKLTDKRRAKRIAGKVIAQKQLEEHASQSPAN